MKRILIFSSAYHPFVGGAEIAVKEITDRIKDAEFDMITINLDGAQLAQEKIGNITVYRVGNKGKLHKLLYFITAYRLAKKLHKTKPYDLVWSIMASYSGFAARKFKKKYPNVPFLLTLQEGDPIEYITKQVKPVYAWFVDIFTRADHIQAISKFLADWARSLGAQARISVIPNGVDIQKYSQNFSEQELTTIKAQYKIEPQDTVLVTTSRLVEKNAVADIIKSLAFLPLNVKLLVVGDGQLRQSLEALAEEGNMKNRVIFAGNVAHAEIPKYLKISHIFIRPSLSEGMGNSFVEAMAAGLPVVATPVGGIPDFLIHEETGLFAAVKDPESISQQVQKLLELPQLKEKIVSNGLKLVQEKYDWNLVAKQMEGLLLSNLK